MQMTKTAAVLIAFLLTGFTSVGFADDNNAPSKAELEKQQKAQEAFAKPGKPHRWLRRFVGRWKGDVTMYMAPGKASKSTGRARFRMVMGGRYVQQFWRGEFVGKPFQGMGITGYDNAKKKYVSSWIDNFGTGIMRSEGSYDAETRTMTETGTSSSPQGDMKMKTITKFDDRNRFTLTMFVVTPQGEQKIMEIKYTRDTSKRKGSKADK
ncbi:MAG: DUF1579 domain-containing protein [Planctomycetaceae bacterium]